MTTHTLRIQLAAVLMAWISSIAWAQSSPAPSPVAKPANELAQDDGKLLLLLSPYTVHFNPKPTHRHVYLIGLEKNFKQRKSSWVGIDYDFYGLSYFSNSFGQPSVYGYAGRTYRPMNDQRFFVKVSAGLIYGYKGEFKDQAGRSFGGFSPVIFPSLGWQYDERSAFQVNVLGTAGAMFMYTRTLD